MAVDKIAFIGTGAMGEPMSARLLQAGFPLTIHSRTRARAAALLAGGAAWADSVADAGRAAKIVLTCLPSNEITEEVLTGSSGIIACAGVACVVDFSTSGPAIASRIGRRLAEKGIAFIDAPVTGGVPRAKTGALTIITAGAPEAIEMVRPVLSALGTNIFVAGTEPGQAQTVKIINNMLNYLALAATSEAMVLGAKAGLDAKLVLDVLNTGTGKNSATEVKFPKSVLPRTFDYGSTNYTVGKDLGLFIDEAERLGVRTPIASQLAGLWETWTADHAKEDLTTIVKLFEAWAGGVEVRGRS